MNADVEISHYVYFRTEAEARLFAAEMRRRGYLTEESVGDLRVIVREHRRIESLDEATQLIERQASLSGGTYDGNELQSSNIG